MCLFIPIVATGSFIYKNVQLIQVRVKLQVVSGVTAYFDEVVVEELP